MAKLLALLGALLLASVALAGAEADQNRKMLAAKPVPTTINWRDYNNIDLFVKKGDVVVWTWTQGHYTTIVQLPPPGNCVNGTAVAAVPFAAASISVKGNTAPSKSGSLTMTFNKVGSFYLTSPQAKQCDTKWVKVTVRPSM